MINVQQYCIGIRKTVRDVNRLLFGTDRRDINPYASPTHSITLLSEAERNKEIGDFLRTIINNSTYLRARIQDRENSEFINSLSEAQNKFDCLNDPKTMSSSTSDLERAELGRTIVKIGLKLQQNERFKDYPLTDLCDGVSVYLLDTYNDIHRDSKQLFFFLKREKLNDLAQDAIREIYPNPFGELN